jgi:hypothetical protein
MGPPSGKLSKLETGEIRTLQYGRGVAALLVCLFHYEGEKIQLQAAAGAIGRTNLTLSSLPDIPESNFSSF